MSNQFQPFKIVQTVSRKNVSSEFRIDRKEGAVLGLVSRLSSFRLPT
jgi:hypothetical protein